MAYHVYDWVFTSSGECRGGRFTGSITGGLEDDLWGFPRIQRLEYSFVDGILNGPSLWQEIVSYAAEFGGGVRSTAETESVFVNGRLNGRYIRRETFTESEGSSIEEGSYVDGVQRGIWVKRWTDKDGEGCTQTPYEGDSRMATSC